MSEHEHHDVDFLVEQAWRQVGRAATTEDRARALSTFRRSIATARKHAGEATPALLERIRDLEDEAGRLYDEAAADAHVRKAIRALGSLRMAIETRLAARETTRPITVRVTSAGREVGSWEADRDQVAGFYGIPPEHGDDRIVVQMHLDSEPTVRAYRGRKLAWSKHGRPFRGPKHRLALPSETPQGNGDGHR